MLSGESVVAFPASGETAGNSGSCPLGRPGTVEARFATLLTALDRELSRLRPEEVPGLLTALLTRAAAVSAGLLVGAKPEPPAGLSASAPRLLSDAEAADVAGVSIRWLRRHTRRLSFRHDLSRKQVRYEEPGLRRWLMAVRTR